MTMVDPETPVTDEVRRGDEPPPGLPDDHSGQRAHLLRRAGHELLGAATTFSWVAVYTTLIITFGFQVARVEGRSMEPTLQHQDKLIVNKAAYRFFGKPQPGDIVMLRYPRDPETTYVKRIVADERDTVRIEDGRLYVNEALQPDAFVPAAYRSHENFGPEVVRDSYYFVMGDHRNQSSDSRNWGQVPEKYIIGRVQLRWWPLANTRLF
jgi:signal peptidase I